MSRNNSWDDASILRIKDIHAEGKTNREIAEITGRSVNSIAMKLNRIGLQFNRAPSMEPHKLRVMMPMPPGVKYEDVTPREAAIISFGAPRSALYSKQNSTYPFSDYGSAAAMCVA